MTTAWLQASLAYWRRQYGIARGLADKARRDAHAGGRGIVTDAEAEHIRKRDARVKECQAMMKRRKRQLAEKGKTAKPRIITARQLGLSFRYVFGPKGAVFRGAGHYTAGPRASNAVELAGEMRRDHAFHMGKGWGGLAYEAMIADDGTIGFGNPMDRRSAGVGGANTGLVNICCPGTTGDQMTEAQKQSIRWLLANWHTAAVPQAHRLPRPAGGLEWRGHKEYPGNATACPGAMLPEYKELWNASR